MAEYVERGKITELALAALNDYKESEAGWITEVSTDIYNELSDLEQEVKARIEEITSIPAADVVEVVRCENCAEYDPNEEWCNFWQHYRQPYFFCAHGKRRSDND